jgi:lysyl-tRNA synthetase class 2
MEKENYNTTAVSNITESKTTLEEIINTRKEKIKKLQQLNINPYPNKYRRTHTISEVIEKYNAIKASETVKEYISIAGRIISLRIMGKSTFMHLQSDKSKIQVYFRVEPEESLTEKDYNLLLDIIDIGDFIGVEGYPFRTKTGELTIYGRRYTLLAKALRPLPEKWHGLKDIELRYRQRYLDLIMNPEVRETFDLREKIIKEICNFLDKQGFSAVETPMMHVVPGGALARPFVTHHNALDIDLYLRIAPELYLKRLLVGGYEKVYEINRNFRNEGISVHHNPEFTMLELYCAYMDYEEMMKLCEEMLYNVVVNIFKSEKLKIGAQEISFAVPFRRVNYFTALRELTGVDVFSFYKENKLKELYKQLMKDEATEEIREHKILDHIFEKYVLPEIKEPTFVTDYPSKYSPLAKRKSNEPLLCERFELFICGEEVANAYSELNDPQEQHQRFIEQSEYRNTGDTDAMMYDKDYIISLEYGLPPAAGLGIGIDRLVMILANKNSIREVILFPLMKPER